MKYLISILTVALLSAGCNSPEAMMEVSVNIRNNPQNQQVSFVTMDYSSFPLQLDTTEIKQGTASGQLTTSITEPGIYYILFDKDSKYIILVNDQDKIEVNADWNNLSDYTISSPASATLKKLLATADGYLKPSTASKPGTATITDSLRNVYNQQQQNNLREYHLFLKQFADTTTQAPVAMYALGLLKQQQTDSSVLKAVTQKLLQRFPQNPAVKNFSSSYFEQLAKEAKMLVPGKKAPVFSLPDTSGQLVSLSAYIGKYTLVEFWASWCAICRSENPAIVSAYNNFKDKNFAILGVSLDKEKSAWLHAIQKDNLTWQHVSDLKEWKSPLVDLYNIEALPYNVLLDPEGKIVAMNLTGHELQNRLAVLLN